MNILKYINIPVFFISFAIGIFLVYVSGSDIKEIYMYSLPEIVEYKDDSGECFVFEKKEIKCNGNEKSVL